MARTKAETAVQDFTATDADTPGLPAMTEAANQFAQIEANYNADRDIANQVLGEAFALEAVSKFSLTVRTSRLAFIKENKLYRALKGRKTPDGQDFSGTWEDFCGLLNRSVATVDEDIRNLKSFGEDALESMQRIGVGIRELREYRRLPENEKDALIEAAKSGDKDTFVDLAETLISRHAKEKADLTNKVNELDANYEAQARVLEQKNSAFDNLAQQFHAREKLVQTKAPDDVARDLRLEANAVAFAAEHTIHNELIPTFRALLEHAETNGGDHREYLLGLLVQVEMAALRVREEFNFDHERPQTDKTPDWLKQGLAERTGTEG